MTNDVIGAVLAGGLGRRIGGDKPSLDLGGESLVTRAVSALRATGLDIALVLRPDQEIPRVDDPVSVVRDVCQNAGPLGGLHALLGSMIADWALVLSCDQPFVQPALVRGLFAAEHAGMDAIVPAPSGAIEPFPGLYGRSCLSAAERALSSGSFSMQALLASTRTRRVSEETLRGWDPELRSFINVNTPADLARARAVLAAQQDAASSCFAAGGNGGR